MKELEQSKKLLVFKKAGSIVPRYLVTCGEPKSRHLVKFGCDVSIEGRTISPLSDGCILRIPSVPHVNKKKRQRTVKGFDISNIHVVGRGYGITAFGNT